MIWLSWGAVKGGGGAGVPVEPTDPSLPSNLNVAARPRELRRHDPELSVTWDADDTILYNPDELLNNNDMSQHLFEDLDNTVLYEYCEPVVVPCNSDVTEMSGATIAPTETLEIDLCNPSVNTERVQNDVNVTEVPRRRPTRHAPKPARFRD
jgi:hypothetical protein